MEDGELRTFFGYLLTLLLVPLFSILIILTFKEWSSFQPLLTYLDRHVALKEIRLPQNSYITAADGTVISEIQREQNREYLEYEQIPQFIKDVFVTIEDRHFFEHSGIDAVAISRAILVNSQNQSIEQGGSTITQQLARNLFLNHEKTYNRKLSELLYSYQLERQLSKEEILELYLNAIYFQNGAYGIQAASRYYFQKPVSKLSKAEMAFLASIPNNPSLYDPLKHFDQTKERQIRILEQLLEVKKISKAEFDQLKNEKILLKIRKRIDLYPDYVTYVESELKELVAQSEGMTAELESKDAVRRAKAEAKLNEKVTKLLQSGVTIHTALDKSLQDKVKRTIENELTYPNVQGAAVVIQHHTHELVSLIGGKHYKKYTFNRAFQSFRQPGSAIKPLLVYAPYLDRTGADLNDRVNAGAFCHKGYCPQNYGGAVYGQVTLKRAFAHSYNTPAIRLLQATGIKNSFSYLKPFRFSMVTEQDHVLSAAVGGFSYGISPLELTSAYTSFQDGSYQPARAIRKVTDRNGTILYEWKDKKVRVWKDATVTKMKELLHSVVTEGTARKAYYKTSYIGGKTGTTNDVKDLWFVGMDETYTTGVWIGKDQPKSLEKIASQAPHLKIWKKIMQ